MRVVELQIDHVLDGSVLAEAARLSRLGAARVGPRRRQLCPDEQGCGNSPEHAEDNHPPVHISPPFVYGLREYFIARLASAGLRRGGAVVSIR
jgi:hypothetical protein